jgi:thymidylate synthase (FAD)
MRGWRKFFKDRTAKAAHPQMREITIPMLEKFQDVFPIIFDDIEV